MQTAAGTLPVSSPQAQGDEGDQGQPARRCLVLEGGWRKGTHSRSKCRGGEEEIRRGPAETRRSEEGRME